MRRPAPTRVVANQGIVWEPVAGLNVTYISGYERAGIISDADAEARAMITSRLTESTAPVRGKDPFHVASASEGCR